MKNIHQVVIVTVIFIILVLGCGGRSEEQVRDQQAEQAREDIAKQLSNAFDSRPECIFKFRATGTQSKILHIKNCSPTTARIQPEQVLTNEVRIGLKNLGFVNVEIESWESAFRSQTSVYYFKDDGTLEFVRYE